MRTKEKKVKGGKWKFIADENRTPEQIAEDLEQEQADVLQMLGSFASMGGGGFAGRCAAVEEFTNYFPGANEVPEGGAWVLVKDPPFTEYTVPPLSLWFAEPWDMDHERRNSHRVKIITPKGELGLFPREYSIVSNPEKYLKFIGKDMTIKFFGSTTGVPPDALFYLRSRGVKKEDAITMLIGQVRSHGVCWIETSPEVCEYFGMEYPHESRLATITK